MTLEFICNGYHKKTHDEITYSLEIEVENDYPKYFKDLLQNGELTYSHDNNTIVIALRELSWFKNLIFRYVTEINEKPAHIYMVLYQWSNERFYGYDDFLHNDYNTAKEQYKQLIEEANDADSWVGSEAFDENGSVREGFNLECSKETHDGQSLFWKVTDLHNSKRYSIITLTKVETL